MRLQWSNMRLLDITSSIYKGFPVDPSVIENAVLNFIESQALVLLPCPKSDAADFLTIVPKIWEGILKAFSYYWNLRGGLRMKLTRSLVEMLCSKENVKIERISATFVGQLRSIIKEAARMNFLRVKDSIPGEFSFSKLNGILQACLAELGSDLKMFDFHQQDEDSAFTGDEYFKSIARVFWFGGVEVKSIGPNGEIVTAEPHNCIMKDAVVLTGCLPDWIAPNEVLYANTTGPDSIMLLKAKNIPGKQVFSDLKPDRSHGNLRAAKLSSDDKTILKTVDIDKVSLSTGVFSTLADHGFIEGDRIALSGYVPYPFYGKKFMHAVVKETDKRSFQLSLVPETPPSTSLFYKTYLRKEAEMALLPLLEDKLNSGSMEIDESLFDLYSTIEELWEFLVDHGVVNAIQKFNFETQFKALFLKWTAWVDTRLREKIMNAVKLDVRITEASGSSICTSTEDTMTMVRLFLSKYLSSDLGKRYIPTMLEKFGGAFAFYVDQIHARATANLSQIENTWGEHNDAVYRSVKEGDVVLLRQTIKQFKAQGFNLSQWIGATKAETRGGVFHVAAKYHQYDESIMRLLKEENCHPNAQDSLQCTCVHTLARQLMKNDKGDEAREFAKFLDALFQHFPDVNVNIVDHTSQTPIQIVSSGTSEFIEDVRRKLEARGNGEEQTLFSPVLDVDFCAHVNSINYILMNAPELMQEHADNEEQENQDDDSIYNALRSLRKHCRTTCSLVLRRAFQLLCSTVITPVLKHVIGVADTETSVLETTKKEIAKAILKVVPGKSGEAPAAAHAQPKFLDRDLVVRDSNYLIKAIQEQMMGPIMIFISEGDSAPVSDRVKERRLKFVRDYVLPEFWACILETVESFLLPILTDETSKELSIYDAKLLQKLVIEVLPQVFALYDSESEKALGLDDNYFKRHAGTNRLKLLFALYCVPVRRLCDMHGKLLQDEGIRRAWNIQPVDVLRIIRSWRNKYDLAKEYLKNSGSQNEDWELCVRFKLPDTERRLATFMDVEEQTANAFAGAVSGIVGVGAQKGVLYLLSSHLVCEWTRHVATATKLPTIIKLTDLKQFEVDVSTSGSSDKLYIHYNNNSTAAVLALRVKSAAEIIVPSRQAAVQAGNRRVKEFKGTADERSALKAKFDLSSDELLIYQHHCTISDINDRQQMNGLVYLFSKRLIFQADTAFTQNGVKFVFFFEKTTFKQSQSTSVFSMKCRRETGETYRPHPSN